MDRLTNRMTDGTAYVQSETGNEGVGYFTTQRRLPELINRLAAYEDTEFTPEDCAELKTLCRLYDQANLTTADIQWLIDHKDNARNLESDNARLRAENVALMEACWGRCNLCKHAKPYHIAPRSPSLRTCPYMSERNVLASTGHKRCEYWKFKAPAPEGTV